jgi:hypothetical protein
MEDEEEYQDGLGDDVEFGLAISDKGEVLMLVRTNYEEGSMEYRVNGEWNYITPDKDIPILDDNPLTRVTGDAVAIWDSVEEDAKEKDFEEVILDK